MTKPLLAPAFCQVAWVVRDMAIAEKFFVETMGISRFMHMDNLAAKDTEGTYRRAIRRSRACGCRSSAWATTTPVGSLASSPKSSVPLRRAMGSAAT